MGFFALLLIVLKASQALGHCSDKWPDCSKGKNTVCLREEDCSAVDDCEAGPMTYNVRKRIVDLHNQLRNEVAGGVSELPGVQAANMMIISYDSDLQHTADCHINRCQWGHDDCRGTKKFKTAGQNLYMSTEKSGDLKLGFAQPEKYVEDGVQAWYDEIKLANPTQLDAHVNNPATGHWTQLIWAATTHVGCGQSGQKSGAGGYLACNYGPAGNVMNKKVVEKGDPCTKCPAGQTRNSKYNNLCGEEDTSMLSVDFNAGTKIKSGNFGIMFLILPIYTMM